MSESEAGAGGGNFARALAALEQALLEDTGDRPASPASRAARARGVR